MARPKKRLILIGTQLVVVAALILGLIGFVGNNKTVAVNIDGQQQEISTFAGDVRGALEAGDIEIAAGDEVSPSLDEAIANGDVITIARNKEIQLEVDGETKTYTTTAATLGEFLKTVDLDDDAQIGADLDAELVSFSAPIEVRTPKKITVTKAGKKSSFTSTADTLGEALEENDMKLGKTHKLYRVVKGKNGKNTTKTVKPTAKLNKNFTLVIKAHTTKNDTETVEVPFETKRTNDDSLFVGQEKVKTKGQTGVKTITYKLSLVDGKVKDKEVTGEEITKKPVNAEILVGTKERPTPTPTPTQTQRAQQTQQRTSTPTRTATPTPTRTQAPKTTTANVGGAWQALAQCESGGNWSINTGNGYYGGLQFSASSWAAAGGTQYAPLPHLATPAQQIATAERLKANGGWGHWPACSARLGLR